MGEENRDKQQIDRIIDDRQDVFARLHSLPSHSPLPKHISRTPIRNYQPRGEGEKGRNHILIASIPLHIFSGFVWSFLVFTSLCRAFCVSHHQSNDSFRQESSLLVACLRLLSMQKKRERNSKKIFIFFLFGQHKDKQFQFPVRDKRWRRQWH